MKKQIFTLMALSFFSYPIFSDIKKLEPKAFLSIKYPMILHEITSRLSKTKPDVNRIDRSKKQLIAIFEKPWEEVCEKLYFTFEYNSDVDELIKKLRNEHTLGTWISWFIADEPIAAEDDLMKTF